MIDRGIIKWAPFNSCFASQEIVDSILTEKSKIKMPILSDDQIYLIEEIIVDAFNLQEEIYISYFWRGSIKKENGIISYINKQEKKICLNNKHIYFKQILNISVN